MGIGVGSWRRAGGRIDIGDFVWRDQNANGLQDAGEVGINGVRGAMAGTTATARSSRRRTRSSAHAHRGRR
ncbi:MAG: SdrD B-like domain-containing protein [Caldilineaceae bacterium]